MKRVLIPIFIVSLFSLISIQHMYGNINQTGNSSIGDKVWHDKNANGIQDNGEPGIAGINVLLFDNSNSFTGLSTTNTNGQYIFDNLPPGQYFVKFPAIEGLIFTTPNVGSDALDSDIDQNGITPTFNLAFSQNITNLDAGYKGNITVYFGNSINTCEGNEVEITANLLYGKAPFQFAWSNGLGVGNETTKVVSPTETTIYSVTVTDAWGTTDSDQIVVRVKNGIGAEICEYVDNFTSGNSNALHIEVSPGDPGPKHVLESGSQGLIGVSRSVNFEYLSGIHPANLDIDYNQGLFSNSNDVGTKSMVEVCYNNAGQGLSFDLTQYDYFKFENIAVDQGGITMSARLEDANGSIEFTEQLPGLGSQTIFDSDLPIELIPNINQINVEEIQQLCFDFYPSNPSVDFQFTAIAICKSTDCNVLGSPDVEICLGESTVLMADAPCSDDIIYFWDNGLGYGKQHVVSPTVTTEYQVVAMDMDGCTSVDFVTVTVNPKPILTLGDDLITCEEANFTINAVASAGTPPFEYTWSNDSNNKTASYSGIATANTSIFVTVTDDKGCSSSDEINIIVNENPEASVSSTVADCQVANGSATVVPSGGSGPYDILWSNGETTEQITGLLAGPYQVTVTDQNGCTDIAEVIVNEQFCGKIGDYVWIDKNADGVQDPDESGIEGVEVILHDGALNPIATTFTSATGYYVFNALEPGDYHVLFNAPAGYTLSAPNQTQDDNDSDADPLSGLSPTVTLALYEENLTIDAGMYEYASIGNYVWLDNDGDGIQDPGENGIPNVTVWLQNCQNINLQSTQTDGDGLYLFDELIPGDYALHFELPAGYVLSPQNEGNDDALDSDPDQVTATSSCESLESGEENLTYDAGLYEPASIGDYVWHDLDGDGIQDPNEPGYPGILVTLTDCNDNEIASVQSDENGAYQFDNLQPGAYKIKVGLPANYEFSPMGLGDPTANSDMNPGTGISNCEILESGEENNDIDAGIFHRAAIGNYVWVDLNGNGMQDADESGIGQVSVQLMDCSNNILDTKVTDANGQFLFDNLLPGDYMLEFIVPAGYYLTAQYAGSDPEMDSNPDPQSFTSSCEILVSGEENLSFDAGIYQYASLGDFVWDDLNVDGIQNGGEPGIENIKVILEDCNNNEVAVTYTDVNGYYHFENVVPGEYQLDFSDNVDTYFTEPYQGGNDEADSDVNPFLGLIECFVLESNEENNSYDAGVINSATLGDYVWEDLNGNGQQDSGEPGVAGIVVKLYKVESQGDLYVTETVTDNNGGYLFEYVIPGDYYVEFMLPEDYDVTEADVGADLSDSDITGANGPNTTSTFTLNPGAIKLDVDAGVYQCSLIGDLMWCDYTQNNHWDPTENGINGVEVRLWRQGTNDNWYLYDETHTGWKAGSTCGDGYWEFCAPPGTYYVEFVIPYVTNLLPVAPNDGPEEYDSDITHANGENTTDVFTLVSQEEKTDFGAGYYYGVVIGDYVWEDSNQNGIQDANENGIENVLVELFNDMDEKLGEYTTDENGYYQFDHLDANVYYIKVNAPDGYEFTAANAGTDEALDSDITNGNGEGTSEWMNMGMQEKNYDVDAGLILSQGTPPPSNNPEEEEQEFMIYPNPSKNKLSVEYFNKEEGTINIYITNSAGDFVKEISDIVVNKEELFKYSMDLSDLPAGRYYLKILGGDHQVKTKKFTLVK